MRGLPLRCDCTGKANQNPPAIWIALLILSLCLPVSSGKSDELNELLTAVAGSVGTGQNVAVVLCRYQGLNNPIQHQPDPSNSSSTVDIDSSQAIADLMSTLVNEQYLRATRVPNPTPGSTLARVSFNFIPVPRVCNFSYPNDRPIDDPGVTDRELKDGIHFADESVPNLFDTTSRVLVVVNAEKRNRATPVGPMMLPNSGFSVLTGAIIDIRAMRQHDLRTVSHEVGHMLGLPDLYRERDRNRPATLSLPDHIAQWGVMGRENNQNFSAYSRHAARWIDNPDERVITISPPTTQGLLIDQEFDLGLPNNDQDLPELIRLNVSDTGAGLMGSFGLNGYLIEARNPLLDPADANLQGPNPGRYMPGVLVFRQRGWANAFINDANTGGIDPYPRPITICGTTRASCGTVSDAATASLQPGASFTDAAAGITIDVLSQSSDGGFRLRVRWSVVPRSDIAITRVLLDNPLNGMGSFQSPSSYGDPIAYTATINWSEGFPSLPLPPTITPMGHAISLTLTNRGSAAPPGPVEGVLFVAEPRIPAGIMTDIDQIRDTFLAEFPFSVPAALLAPGSSRTLTFPFTPTGPFVTAVFVKKDNELAETHSNNERVDAFILFELASGSPFSPMDLTLPLTNINDAEKRFRVSLTPLEPFPDQWKVETLENAAVSLGAGESTNFRVKLQPPSPEDVAKPSYQGKLDVTTWMSDRDFYVPVSHLPIYYNLVEGTRVQLETASGSPDVRGRLVRIEDGVNLGGIANQGIEIVVSNNLGNRSAVIVKTDVNGDFRKKVDLTPGACHAVIARFTGTPNYGSSQSQLERIISRECPGIVRRPIAITRLDIVPEPARPGQSETYMLVMELSDDAPRGGATISLAGSVGKYFRIPASVTIPQGRSEIRRPIEIIGYPRASRPVAFEPLELTARYGESEKTTRLTVRRNRTHLRTQNGAVIPIVPLR